MSEANRQDCAYCLSSPCSCTEDEIDNRLYEESKIYDFGDDE